VKKGICGARGGAIVVLKAEHLQRQVGGIVHTKESKEVRRALGVEEEGGTFDSHGGPLVDHGGRGRRERSSSQPRKKFRGERSGLLGGRRKKTDAERGGGKSLAGEAWGKTASAEGRAPDKGIFRGRYQDESPDTEMSAFRHGYKENIPFL